MNTSENHRLVSVVRWLAVIATAILSFRIAWLSDDSLITLRTLLNITHGWGAGYNATEAVQAYTHPMWFLSWMSVGVLTNQWVYGILLFSVALTALAVGVLVWQTQSIVRILTVVGMLLFSNSFMEYSASGLENPMAYLTVAIAFALSLQLAAGNRSRRWVRPLLIGLVLAAILLTRFDLVFLVAPAILVLLVAYRHKVRVLGVAIASFLIPLIVWFGWSWVTYHSLLPNTYAAKRNTDIPQIELVVQGLRYLYVSFEKDPITLLVLVLGISAGLAFGSRLLRAWTIGILLYLGYVLWIGGDFMAGRFLAVPVLVCALILVSVQVNLTRNSANRDPLYATAVAVVFLVFLLVGSSLAGSTPSVVANPQSPRWEFEQNTNASVSDERGFYVASGLGIKNAVDNLSLAYINPDIAPLGDGSGLSRTLREVSKAAQNWPYNDGGFTLPSEVGVFCGGVGYLGLATGPITHIIDSCALTDRFLAGQPYTPVEPFAWRPGHLSRAIPEGYVEAIQTGDPIKVRDTAQAFELQQLWSRIR